MKIKLSFALLLIFTLFSLTACGFHLRGREPLPAQLHILYVDSDSPYSPLTKEIKRALLRTGIVLTDRANESPLILKISDGKYDQAVTSTGASGQTSTYNLTYTVTYSLLSQNGETIIPTTTVTSTRSYSITTNQYLGGMNNQLNLEGQMQREVVYQILDRLRSRQAVQALQSF